MKISRLMIAVLALGLAGCEAEEDDTTVATLPAEDSVAMDPEHIPAAGMDVPPGGIGETLQLQPLDGSGVGGEVTVADRGEQTEVMVRLTGAPANGSHPGHVHTGTCEALGGVVQPLDPITTDGTGTGSMTTNVSVAPMTLMNGQHIVVYHGTGGRPIACANIPGHTM